MLKRFTASLQNEFAGYHGSSLAKDLMAGLTVTAVALPLALAFGVSSGATAASGLITAIIAGLIMSMLSGGFYQISGPTGAMAAILMSIIANYQIEGVFLATFLAGIILLLAGIFRLGRLVSFIPAPVITGFTSGIAVIIALGQVDNFFGVTSKSSSAVAKLLSYGSLGFSPSIPALAIGLGVLLLMVFFPKKWGAVVPASLVAIILATAVSLALDLDVKMVGEIPKTLIPAQRLTLAAMNPSTALHLLAPAFSIAMLGMIESLLCGASAGKMTGKRLDGDQELIAQGVGNLLIPFFGGIPATAAIARTSVAIKSGAQTRLTGVFHAVGLLISMFLLSPVMSKIPLSALAGVLMVTAWRMNDWESIRFIFSHKFKGAILKFCVTMIATIVFDLTVAILVGVGVSLILLIAKLSKMEVIYDDESSIGTMIAHVTGPIVFANTDALDEISSHLHDEKHLILSMTRVSLLDISGAQILLELFANLQKQGVSISLCGIPPKTKVMMQRADIPALLGDDCFFETIDDAENAYQAKLCGSAS